MPNVPTEPPRYQSALEGGGVVVGYLVKSARRTSWTIAAASAERCQLQAQAAKRGIDRTIGRVSSLTLTSILGSGRAPLCTSSCASWHAYARAAASSFSTAVRSSEASSFHAQIVKTYCGIWSPNRAEPNAVL